MRTETELAVEIHEAIKNHVGHTVNLAVAIMGIIKSKELFIHHNEVHEVIEVDYRGGHDDSEEYIVYVEPTEE